MIRGGGATAWGRWARLRRTSRRQGELLIPAPNGVRPSGVSGEKSHSETVMTVAQTRGLAWLPDGSGLVYSSSKGSTVAYPPVFSLRTIGRDGLGDDRLPVVKLLFATSTILLNVVRFE